MRTISEIKNSYIDATVDDIEAFIRENGDDERSGVKKLVDKALRDKDALIKELKRIDEMKAFDKSFTTKSYIAGMDEVGRGPFAGPVCVAAVILPKDCDILYINDSKKVSKSKRAELDKMIKEQAIAYSYGLVSSTTIDEINILEATRYAMKLAVEGLNVKPDFVLVDSVKKLDIDVPYSSMDRGDALSYSIAAASIIAKVHRDKIMEDYAKEYPQYGFDRNSGYGTAEHIEAIKKYGPCPIHRMSFIGNVL